MNPFAKSLSLSMLALLGWTAPALAAGAQTPGDGTSWVIETAQYTGEIKEHIARVEGRYTINVLQDGRIEIPLVLQGATVTDIEIERKTGAAHLIPRAGFYGLSVQRKGIYKVRVKFAKLLDQDSQFEGVRLGIPQATCSTLSLLVPRKDVELRPQDELSIEREPNSQPDGVKLLVRLGAATQIDLRWKTKPAAPAKVEPVLYGEVHTLVTLEEQLARLMSVITYRMAQGEAKSLTLTIPSDVNILNVRGAGIEDWRVTDGSDRKILTVSLGFGLKDTTYQLIVEGEEAIRPEVSTYLLPAILLEGVKQERGYLAVVRMGNLEVASGEMEGITRIDVRELPELMQGASGASAIVAFKYHQHPYRVSVSLTRHEDHPVLAAIAEQAELVTVLSRQGEFLTRATYLIKANKKQFLEVKLPQEATLWSCLVGGKSVKPVVGTEGVLLVPLDAMAETTSTVSMELVYFEHRKPLERIGQLRLQGPVLDVPTTIVNWMLYAPREVRFLRVGGNLEHGAAAYAFLEESFGTTMVMAAEVTHSAIASSQLPAASSPYSFAQLQAEEMSEQAQRAALQPDAQRREDGEGAFLSASMGSAIATLAQLRERGILPLKIRLPQAGAAYRFNRLMTTHETLTLDATFVHLRMGVVWATIIGLAMLSLWGLLALRFRRV